MASLSWAARMPGEGAPPEELLSGPLCIFSVFGLGCGGVGLGPVLGGGAPLGSRIPSLPSLLHLCLTQCRRSCSVSSVPCPWTVPSSRPGWRTRRARCRGRLAGPVWTWFVRSLSRRLSQAPFRSPVFPVLCAPVRPVVRVGPPAGVVGLGLGRRHDGGAQWLRRCRGRSLISLLRSRDALWPRCTVARSRAGGGSR